MWTYILRRLLLMIPTLFGVTVVSFCIMQLAPGDPQLTQMGPGGMTGQSTETREAYLIRKRDLNLDKPLLLNFRYFRDFSDEVRVCAHYLGLTPDRIAAELPKLAAADTPEARRRLAFLRGRKIYDFDTRLADPEQHGRLAEAIQVYARNFCEDYGLHLVPAAVAILREKDAPLELRIGAIRALGHMVPEPFHYTYSADPDPGETEEVTAVWARWWKLAGPTFPELDPDRRKVVARLFAELAGKTSRSEQLAMLDRFYREDMPYFVEKLLGDSTLPEKTIAAATLKLYVSRPLETSVPLDADAETVDRVAENWLLHARLYPGRYAPGAAAKLWYIVGDTQYAHMVWRLATFNFGRSAVKTREPVAGKIVDAVIVSAPLMVMAQLVIYLVAVPLGIVCAVNRDNAVDRSISVGLFLLYSIPPFVAGMLFLLFFAYGSYLKIFPMLGLHSTGADEFGFFRYFLDYVWHATLPVVCLSLFSLAGMAMYSRTSMLDAIGQDYIRTARAKGLSQRKVIFKHALRNSLIPILTLFSNFLPAMLGGSVLIEVIFSIPGMGRLSWESILLKDFPTLMAMIYIDAIVVMISILMTDILYVVADPRISFQARGKAA